MSAPDNDPILFNLSASRKAFRVGQMVETLLLKRGLEQAQSAHLSIVTAEMIESCIDQSLFHDLRTQLNDRAEQESRGVA